MLLTTLPFLFIYTGLTLSLSWYDSKTGLLPDRLTCPLLWSGLLFYAWLFPQLLAQYVLGAIAGYVAFAGMYWLYRGIRKKEGMGYGDVKFFAALGAWHGWQFLPLLATFACLLAAMFICIRILASGSIELLKSPLRFGPFLSAAGFMVAGLQWLSFPL